MARLHRRSPSASSRRFTSVGRRQPTRRIRWRCRPTFRVIGFPSAPGSRARAWEWMPGSTRWRQDSSSGSRRWPPATSAGWKAAGGATLTRPAAIPSRSRPNSLSPTTTAASAPPFPTGWVSAPRLLTCSRTRTFRPVFTPGFSPGRAPMASSSWRRRTWRQMIFTGMGSIAVCSYLSSACSSVTPRLSR